MIKLIYNVIQFEIKMMLQQLSQGHMIWVMRVHDKAQIPTMYLKSRL